ncbi:MAG: PDZ domain-containing protein [Clostridia bacterium]|nr:PDZ domain-containing protein [Clostridia bacterium]
MKNLEEFTKKLFFFLLQLRRRFTSYIEYNFYRYAVWNIFIGASKGEIVVAIKKKYHKPICLTSAFLIVTLVCWAVLPVAAAAVSLEEEVFAHIQQRYYQPVNINNLKGKTVPEMIDMLPDRYSIYLSPLEVERLMAGVQGRTSGLGLVMVDVNGMVMVSEVYQDSPADAAGIKTGDQVVSINGQTVIGASAGYLTILLNQLEIPRLTMVVKRNNRLMEMELESFSYQRASVTGLLLDNQLLLIKITSFTNNSHRELQDILNHPRNRGAKGYIIDLRDNPGGTFQTALEIAGELVGSGPLVQTIDRTTGKRVLHGEGKGLLKPAIVLVNNRTASSAEIVAAAIQENNKGIILGATTYGKGLIQSIFRLKNGGALQLTTSEYLSPSGKLIEGRGIAPDFQGTASFESAAAVKILESYQLYPGIFGFNKQVILQVDKTVVIVDEDRYLTNAPRLVSSRSFVPLRLMGHLVMATVKWHHQENTAELMLADGTKSIKITPNNREALVDGKVYLLDVPGFVEEGFFYVPVRFVAELLGKKVDWIGDGGKIIISP